MYIYTYIYIDSICVCACTSTVIYIYIYMYVCMYVSIHLSIYFSLIRISLQRYKVAFFLIRGLSNIHINTHIVRTNIYSCPSRFVD